MYVFYLNNILHIYEFVVFVHIARTHLHTYRLLKIRWHYTYPISSCCYLFDLILVLYVRACVFVFNHRLHCKTKSKENRKESATVSIKFKLLNCQRLSAYVLMYLLCIHKPNWFYSSFLFCASWTKVEVYLERYMMSSFLYHRCQGLSFICNPKWIRIKKWLSFWRETIESDRMNRYCLIHHHIVHKSTTSIYRSIDSTEMNVKFSFISQKEEQILSR